MKTSTNNYIENLSLFSHKLRERGVPAGIQQTIDGAHLIEILGFSDREMIRDGLCSIFAKSIKEQRIFFETFDDFFVGEKIQQKQMQQQIEEEQQMEQNYQEAMEDLKYEGKPLDLKDEVKDAYANLPPMDREQIMNYLNISMDNMRNSPFSEWFMVKTIEQQLRLREAMDASSPSLPEELGNLLYKNLSDITEEEIPKVIHLIQIMVKKLNGAISREYKKAGKSGRLDYRATIHQSLRTGGYFNKLIYKKRRRNKKRIILLCDVSGSMLKFSQFAIRFIKSMNDVSGNMETYLFSEDYQKVSPVVLNNMTDFENYVKDSGLLGKATDIGKAVRGMLQSPSSHLTSSCVLLIISDTKTMNLPMAEENLRRAARSAGRIIWMNPIPHDKWPALKSTAVFKSYCQMLDCSTLDNLAKACARLV